MIEDLEELRSKFLTVDNLADLLDVTLDEFEALPLKAQGGDVEVSMSSWCTYDNLEGLCYVCLAGAVLRRFLPSGVNRSVVGQMDVIGSGRGGGIDRCFAVNYLRIGDWESAVSQFYRGVLDPFRDAAIDRLSSGYSKLFPPPGYPGYSHKAWVGFMRERVAQLREVGI